MFVNVTDEHGRLVDKYGLAGFVGTVGSPITYHLLPDAGASDDKGGLVDMQDFLGDGGGAVEAAKTDKAADKAGGEKKDEGDDTRACTGQWNANWEVPQKKDRERWWHAERGRRRGVKLI